MNFQLSATKRSYIHFLATALVATGALTLLGLYFQLKIIDLNISLLYQGVVTYATGAMIAIFIAIFHSDDSRILLLRRHQHAKTIYSTIVTDLIVLVASGLFILSPNIALSQQINTIVLATMITFAASLTQMILKLIKIILH